MYLGNACLFNKTPGDMRRVGTLGGRARARNLRLRRARPPSVAREHRRSHEETAAEAIRRIDARVGRYHHGSPPARCSVFSCDSDEFVLQLFEPVVRFVHGP